MSPSSAICWRRPSAAAMAETFPWRQAMAFGFGRLRLAPGDFWAMTPRELAAAVEGVVGVPPAPLDRGALAALIARYPDEGGTHSDASRS